MAYLGLTPSEHSSGVRWGGITKAVNGEARRAMVEVAWTCRLPARVARPLRNRLERLPKKARDIAWTAQVRLCARTHRPITAGKSTAVVTAAIAREMSGFA